MAFRTQKISQMTPKGSDLEATDLIEVSTIESGSYVTRSITGQELIDAIPAPTGFVPTSRTLTINGTTQDLSANRTFTVSTGITIGTTAITSGTVGRVLFEGTGNVVSQSANLFWDATNNRLGVGTSSPARALDILGSGDVLTGLKTSSATGVSSHVVLNDINSSSEFGVWGSTRSTFGAIGSNNAYIYSSVDFAITSLTNIKFGTGASLAERMRIVSGNGNVLINTTTDAGYKLDVNGTARVNGLVTATLSNYNSTHSGNTTRGFYIVNSADSIVRAGIEYDGTNAFVQLAGRYGNGAAFFRQNGGNGDISFLRNGVEYGRIFGATGNWGINTTTDAGFRLDVNGTARVSGNLTLTGGSLLMNNNNIYIARGTGGASDGMEIRALSSGTDAVKVTTSSVSISSSGGITYQASAQLAVDSTTRGFLPPRMTTTQKNAIASPAAGLMVYDTTLNVISYYNGTSWI